MVALLSIYLVLVFLVPVVLSLVVSYRTLPRGRQCGQCGGESVLLDRRWLRRANRLLPGVRLRVVDWGTGRPLGVDEEGELCVAGATRMLRYLGRRPEDCFDEDGFFHTGDAGHVADDGTVHWAGRRTEMIKTGGANVSPAEVEVALRACPPVKLSRVVGIPDSRLDEVVVACIVLRDGEQATVDDVRGFLRERLAAYKVPKHVLFFTPDEMPMTSSEAKVRDDALLELVQARLGPHDPRPQGAT